MTKLQAIEEGYQGLDKDTTKLVKNADEESFVWRLAGECIRKMDDAGGLARSKYGKTRITKAIMKLLDIHHDSK